MGEMKNAYKILFGKPEEKKPLGRPRHRWKDNIEVDLKEMDVNIIGLNSSGCGYSPVVGSYEHSNENLVL
jgi:hypothetical protein